MHSASASPTMSSHGLTVWQTIATSTRAFSSIVIVRASLVQVVVDDLFVGSSMANVGREGWYHLQSFSSSFVFISRTIPSYDNMERLLNVISVRSATIFYKT